jgi:hypothetical protein
VTRSACVQGGSLPEPKTPLGVRPEVGDHQRMAIIKLVCQGCGANLDALDNQRVFQCGYCGTTNKIKQTVHQQAPAPAPSAAPPSPAPSYAPPAPSYAPPPQYTPPIANQTHARRGVGVFVVMSAILPLVIGGVVAYTAFSQTSNIIEQVRVVTAEVPGAGAADARKYQWESDKPFVADVDGDGREDLIGLIQEVGTQDTRLTLLSGDGWTSKWEVSLGDRSAMPGQIRLFFDPGSKLALFPRGAALTAYVAETGEQRWVSNLSDGVAGIVVDGDTLRVSTIDNKTTSLRLADGKPLADPLPEPSSDARTLRDDDGYDLIPDLRSLDLDSSKQFAGLRIEQAFCPDAYVEANDRRRHEKRCTYPHGLAWASRAEGTRVPFMVGYDPATKAERWRTQLTTPGSLTTVDTGFSQPRAELFGDSAVLGFLPSGGDVTLRRISLVDGSTTWESTIEVESGGAQLAGMVPSDERLYVTYRWVIYVFDLATGERQAQLGGW